MAMAKSHVTTAVVNAPAVKRLLTVGEMASYLQISNATVYRMVRSRDIPCVRVGRSIRFQLDAVEARLEESNRTEDKKSET